MLLALDTATPACTVALFAEDGSLLARVDEVMARGSAERLMPMLEQLLGPARPQAVLVGCGPGSFTGLRVGLAAAHGLALGWGVPLHAMPTLALIAAGVAGTGPIGVALLGGHGELFVQQFARNPLEAETPLASLPPEAAASLIDAPLVVGPGAATLVAARGHGAAEDRLPSAADALDLPLALRSLPPKPLYARAPDARPKPRAAA
jgi:tRNA threonylcarbamoyl adenosine modification protein YeaZ